jgi:hypothetical protein
MLEKAWPYIVAVLLVVFVVIVLVGSFGASHNEAKKERGADKKDQGKKGGEHESWNRRKTFS